VGISEILHRLGYVAQGPSGHCTRDDLRRPVHRPHRPETREISAGDGRPCCSCDEAYYRLPPRRMNGITAPKRSDPAAGDEEQPRTIWVVIFAGYKRPDGCLLSVPPRPVLAGGQPQSTFPNYSAAEAAGVAKLNPWRPESLSLQRRGQCGLRRLHTTALQLAFFANARLDSQCRLIEPVMRQANRLFKPPRQWPDPRAI